MPQLTPQQQQTALERARQLFRFLKAYSERRTPLKRTLADHEWNLPFRILPTHSSIVIGEVLLNTEPTEQGEAGGNGALLTVRRPRLTDPPTPPPILLGMAGEGLDGSGSRASRARRAACDAKR